MFGKLETSWNPWHGCFRVSEGCKNCFIYSMDSIHKRDTKHICLNKNFEYPLKKRRNGEYHILDNTLVYTCFSSDFLLPQADEWRKRAWEIMRQRKNVHFVFFTKRIERLYENLPKDWGEGYENVIIGVSVENQKRAHQRISLLCALPIKHRWVICAPLLEEIHIESYLQDIDLISVGGESGYKARVCDYKWVLSLRQQAYDAGIKFHFHQTGAMFLKDNKLYKIPKNLQRIQAKKANINIMQDYAGSKCSI